MAILTSTHSFFRVVATMVVVAAMAGCASDGKRAPVVDRSFSSRGGADGQRQPPGAENAGKPGYFTVRPGDTLMRIGLETGQSWRDIQRWNALDNPDRIEVGQVLRVVHPSVDPSSTSSRVVARSGTESRPVSESRPVTSGAAAPAAAGPRPTPAVPAVTPADKGTPSAASVPAPVVTAPAASGETPRAAAATEEESGLNWMWPASGGVLAGFDEARNKGLSIAGKDGDPVLAAADGRVVYAGAGLRGYGNLVIIKHNETYLSAYAHNRSLLVKEDQPVRRGQKIAEMGATDAERVQLHFEIRRRGKPIDPAKLLPGR